MNFPTCEYRREGVGPQVGVKKKEGCHSGRSFSFSMNLSSRKLSILAARPWTRAKDTSHTLELLKPGRQFFVFAPWNFDMNICAETGNRKLINEYPTLHLLLKSMGRYTEGLKQHGLCVSELSIDAGPQ